MTNHIKLLNKSETDVLLGEINKFKLFENLYPLSNTLPSPPKIKNLQYGIDYTLFMNKKDNIIGKLYIKYNQKYYKLFIHYNIYINETLLKENCILIDNNKIGFYTYIYENKFVFLNFNKINLMEYSKNNYNINLYKYYDKTFANCIIV